LSLLSTDVNVRETKFDLYLELEILVKVKYFPIHYYLISRNTFIFVKMTVFQNDEAVLHCIYMNSDGISN
jgi:hypothetical protein